MNPFRNRVCCACLWAALPAACALAAPAAHALEGTFNQPTYKKMARLDFCFTFGNDCGQMAADTYCRVQGYERATHFDTEPARPTRIASDGKECNANFCVGFKTITCFTSASEPGRKRDWPQHM